MFFGEVGSEISNIVSGSVKGISDASKNHADKGIGKTNEGRDPMSGTSNRDADNQRADSRGKTTQNPPTSTANMQQALWNTQPASEQPTPPPAFAPVLAQPIQPQPVQTTNLSEVTGTLIPTPSSVALKTATTKPFNMSAATSTPISSQEITSNSTNTVLNHYSEIHVASVASKTTTIHFAAKPTHSQVSNLNTKNLQYQSKISIGAKTLYIFIGIGSGISLIFGIILIYCMRSRVKKRFKNKCILPVDEHKNLQDMGINGSTEKTVGSYCLTNDYTRSVFPEHSELSTQIIGQSVITDESKIYSVCIETDVSTVVEDIETVKDF